MLLHNARIVLSDRTLDNADVLVAGDRIASIFERPAAPLDHHESVIDLTGLTLFPGFIDVHIHGSVGVDTMETDSAGLHEISEFLAGQGVTAWLPTLVPAPVAEYKRAIEAIEELVAQTLVCDPDPNQHRLKSVPHARVLGVHYEGPFVNSAQCGALHKEHFRSFINVAELDELPVVRRSGVSHMMTLAPEIDGGIELIKELKRRSWVVSIGHTRAEIEVLDRALAAGARHLTHFMNAMTPLHHRTLGVAGWGLIRNEVTCDLIADGIHINPAILTLLVNNKTAERISLISDAIAAAGKGDGEYQIWGETIEVRDGRTRNQHGNIAGSVISILDAVRLMLTLGFSESDVARMAATNPAGLLGIDEECGSIAVGKRADLVALDEQLKVRATIIGGNVFRY